MKDQVPPLGSYVHYKGDALYGAGDYEIVLNHEYETLGCLTVKNLAGVQFTCALRDLTTVAQKPIF